MATGEVKTVSIMVMVDNEKGEANTFMRCGRKFYPDARPYEVTEAELAIIQAEPRLAIVEDEKPTVLDAKGMIAAIKAVSTVEELEALWVEGEARKTVVDAYNVRAEELKG